MTARGKQERAMKAAYRRASQEWLDEAWDMIGWYAGPLRSLPAAPFTSEDVRWALPNRVNTRDHRAIGPLFRKAAKAGLIKATGRWIEAKSYACNGRPMREWIGTKKAAAEPWPERKP